jgi:5-formyltetrahydrofolate cyclo-ligase
MTDSKKALRRTMLALRATQDPALGARLAEHILRDAPLQPGQSVAGFWPMDKEIDICPLLHALHTSGHLILLPVTPPRGQPLTFRRWRPGDTLQPERFGTVRPIGEPGVPDLLLVPLLAWDGQGRRLGYGGGYYDRTLAALPGSRTIGCAYAAQRVAEVPSGPYDVPLDAVATELGLTWFSR